jgi:microcompartment protein CcmK/EutM
VSISGFVYSSTVTEPTTSDQKMDLTDTEGEFSTLLENLSSGTTYHIRAYAINSVGAGYGEVVNFTTSNAAPTTTNLTVVGEALVDRELTVSYTYND